MSVERLRDIGEEYARLESRLRELKRRLYDVIIKYLIANSAFRDKCTELGISENLGLKRSVVRRVLKELVDAHILYYVEIGRSKPYSILSIGSALDRGYVSFTKREIQELLAVKEIKKEVLRNVSFEVGVRELGGHPIYITDASIGLGSPSKSWLKPSTKHPASIQGEFDRR